MLSNKDYTNTPLEGLVAAEQRMKSRKTFMAVFIGFLVGIAVWSATHEGGFVTYLLLFFAVLIGGKYNRDLKALQAEISRRNSTLP